MAFKIGDDNVSYLCFRKVLSSGKAWQACAQQTGKPCPHNLCSFISS